MAPKYDVALTTLFANSLRPAPTPLKRKRSDFPVRKGLEAGPPLSVQQPSEALKAPPASNAAPNAIGRRSTTDATGQARLKRVSGSNLEGEEVVHKKRRKPSDNDLESRYLEKLHQEELKDQAREWRSIKSNGAEDLSDGEAADTSIRLAQSGSERASVHSDAEELTLPMHETIDESKNAIDLERASRTVFLGNVSNEAIKSRVAKKTLLNHLSSVFSTLPLENSPHRIESLRFRSTAFSDTSRPKKAAFTKGELMDATTKSTNAYVVYSSPAAAREAARKLNGAAVLDRHLRVDQVAHPAKVDHRRCVFVGNLGFVDDESAMNAASDEAKDRRPRKAKPPADIEEGLWRQFGQAGAVESVRVIRDKTTRVGKGIAYVQFKDSTGVEKALFFDGKKFPPLLPRALRVTRAKKIKKPASHKSDDTTRTASRMSNSSYRAKPSSEISSLKGRSSKLLGRAGAAQLRSKQGGHGAPLQPIQSHKTPQQIIFEGHRASSTHRKDVLKSGRPGRNKQGKPKNRSSRRGAAFKAARRETAKA